MSSDSKGFNLAKAKRDWMGEPGDKRNTKYALAAWGAGPIGIAAYSAHRNSERGQLARAASIEAKRKKRGKRKKSVSKGVGTLVKIPTKVGRFRGAAENTAVRGAGAAGRTFRYMRDNAMPLTIGATVGASGATAYQQTKNRKNTMSKGLPSALRPVAREMKAIRAGAPVAGRRARPGSSSYNTYINNRVSANVHGQMAGRAGLVRVGDGSVARIGGKDKLSPKGQPRLIGGSKGKNVAAEVYLGSQNARAARYMGAGFSPSRRPLRNV